MKHLIVLLIVGLAFSKVKCDPGDKNKTDLEIGGEGSGEPDTTTVESNLYDRVLHKFYKPYIGNGIEATEQTKESNRTLTKRSDEAPNLRKPLIFKRQATPRKPLILRSIRPKSRENLPEVIEEKKVINNPNNGRTFAFPDDEEDVAVDDKITEDILSRMDRARKPLII